VKEEVEKRSFSFDEMIIYFIPEKANKPRRKVEGRLVPVSSLLNFSIAT
jgi:hypothetical protein